MSKKIAILGAGTAGLHLAYELKGKFDITVIERRTPEQMKNGRITSSQAHFGLTKKREEELNMPKWENEIPISQVKVTVGNELSYAGNLQRTAGSVDQRLYYATCIEDLINQGVSFRFEKVEEKDVDALTREFDLIIDSTGKKTSLFPFPTESELAPQRKYSFGYFKGIDFVEPYSFHGTLLPGIGEVMEVPCLTEQGRVDIIGIAGVPDQALDFSGKIKGAEHFTLTIKETLKKVAPHIYSRVDEKQFALSDDKAFMQIAVTPTVKIPYTVINNTLVLGCGDSVFVHDPLTGQGSNLAAFGAEKLSEALMEYTDWNAEVGEAYWHKVEPMVTAVTQWTNAFTSELPPHIIQLFMRGAQDQSAADAIAQWYENPMSAATMFYPDQAQ